MGALQDTVSGLAAGAYYWRVQGVSNNFVQGSWSAPRAVRVTGAGPGAPATPMLNQPRGGTNFHPWESFGMSWKAVPAGAHSDRGHRGAIRGCRRLHHLHHDGQREDIRQHLCQWDCVTLTAVLTLMPPP
jgi:hypothetical protein